MNNPTPHKGSTVVPLTRYIPSNEPHPDAIICNPEKNVLLTTHAYTPYCDEAAHCAIHKPDDRAIENAHGWKHAWVEGKMYRIHPKTGYLSIDPDQEYFDLLGVLAE